MIVLLSGGLDSTVLTAKAISDGQSVEAVSIHSGQRHARELEAAAAVAAHFNIRHDVVDLHDDQSAGGGLEGDPGHRAPRAIISLI